VLGGKRAESVAVGGRDRVICGGDGVDTALSTQQARNNARESDLVIRDNRQTDSSSGHRSSVCDSAGAQFGPEPLSSDGSAT
jgi:hypothetical protein